MAIYGYIHAIDRTHTVRFIGGPTDPGYAWLIDSVHQSLFTGYVLSDSTTLPTDGTFSQEQILTRGDLTLTLADWTYAGGRQFDATTYVDGTWGYRYYNPLWINYSIWYQAYDGTRYDSSASFAVVGSRTRSPVNYPTVGSYYAPMVVPSPPGHYEIRWRYQKDSSSYAKEIDVPFVSLSRGVDSMPDFSFPITSSPSYGAAYLGDILIGVDPGVDVIGLYDLDNGSWNSIPSVPAGF